MPQLSTKNFSVTPFSTTHYRKPVTWYTVKCLKCQHTAEYRSNTEVIQGRKGHLCPPQRNYLRQKIKVIADGATWSTQLNLRIGDRVICPYYYAGKVGTVTALSSVYDGPTSIISATAPYWP